MRNIIFKAYFSEICPKIENLVFFWTAETDSVQCDLRFKLKEEGVLTFKRNYFAAVAITFVAAMTCRAEFQANTRTSDKQENPAIAMDGSGNFVVAWNRYLKSVGL